MTQVTTQGHQPEKSKKGQEREIEDLLDLLVEIALTRLVVDETLTTKPSKSESTNENRNLCALLD